MPICLTRKFVEQPELPTDLGDAYLRIGDGVFPQDREAAAYTALDIAIRVFRLNQYPDEFELPAHLGSDQVEDWLAGKAAARIIEIWDRAGRSVNVGVQEAVYG